MRLLITRPEPDGGALADILAARGIETLRAPLLAIEQVADAALDLEGVTALLVTSANGVRAFAARCPDRSLRLYAVGDASARAAREAGFGEVESAAGDVDALARLVIGRAGPGDGVFLHVAGSRVAGDLGGLLAGAGLRYRRAPLYRARLVETLPAAAASALDAGTLDGALFHSPRTARHFAALVTGAGRQAACLRLTAFCLSQAVAQALAGLAWQRVSVAKRPDQDSLVQLLAGTMT